MRGGITRHLYLTEQEAHVLTNFFITIKNLADENRELDMTELIGKIAVNAENYEKYGQEIQIHYND
jgi:hypothetical protein